jgi:trehalose 6-phosphate synthase/phosphatase
MAGQRIDATGAPPAASAPALAGPAAAPQTRRLILVANRLPVTVRVSGGAASLTRSAGGLATGLSSVHRAGEDAWIGWLGDTGRVAAPEMARIRDELTAQRLIEVQLTTAQVRAFYEELSNGVIWPMFHYMPDRTPLHSRGWKTYREVNERFAEAAAREYQDGDMIWVHDYQLLLVPGMLRERLPRARIGYFLHIPFPSYEIFRMLPWRNEVLHGMLGADVVGFHTATYVHHFTRAVRMVLDLDPAPAPDTLSIDGREVHQRVSPLGVAVDEYEQLADRRRERAQTAAMRE